MGWEVRRYIAFALIIGGVLLDGAAMESFRRKGTPASLRTVLDRFDPLIGIVEWFEDRDTLAPYHFRLELPLLTQSDVYYDENLVTQILRDIAQVKPVRAHMLAVFRLRAQAQAWMMSAAQTGGLDGLGQAFVQGPRLDNRTAAAIDA